LACKRDDAWHLLLLPLLLWQQHHGTSRILLLLLLGANPPLGAEGCHVVLLVLL
jgi:hypothetical protein